MQRLGKIYLRSELSYSQSLYEITLNVYHSNVSTPKIMLSPVGECASMKAL